MSRTQPDRRVEVIYCDDVRQEVGNKTSLMGVYQLDLIAEKRPLYLSKLCMYVTIYTPIERPFERLAVKVLRDDMPVIETGELALPPVSETDAVADGANQIVANLVFALTPFVAETETKLRVVVETEDGEYRGRGLKVRFSSPEAEPVAQQSIPLS